MGYRKGEGLATNPQQIDPNPFDALPQGNELFLRQTRVQTSSNIHGQHSTRAEPLGLNGLCIVRRLLGEVGDQIVCIEIIRWLIGVRQKIGILIP